MSYDIRLTDPTTRSAARVEKHQEGGTFVFGGTYKATMSLTYNYAANYSAVKIPQWTRDPGTRFEELADCFSILWLYGKTGRETAPVLTQVVLQLGTERDHNYWAATDGNAGYAAKILLDWALQYPDCVWEGE